MSHAIPPRRSVPGLLALAALLLTPGAGTALDFRHATVQDYVAGEVLVSYREGVPASRRLVSLDAVSGQILESRPRLGYHRVRLPAQLTVKQAVEALERDPDVAWVEPNYLAYAFAFPFCPQDPFLEDDADSTNQWGIFQTSIYGMWKLGYGGGDPSVVVSIVDSGIDSFASPHADLAPNVAGVGFDAVDNDADPTDVGANKGHGTAVAGVAAAAANTVGIAGVAYCSTLQIVRVMDCSAPTTCTGTTDDIAEGIDWAATNGADVVNLSLGTAFYSQAMRNAVLTAIDAGAVVVAAAGNDGAATIAYPANYPEVIAVGASDSTGGVWSGSNYGANLDVVAPGKDIMAPTVGGYKVRTGTSLAAPFVSGIAALLKSRSPGITHLEAKDWINDHARATSIPFKDGNGEVFYPSLADWSDGQGLPPVGHLNFLWEWLGMDVTPEAADFDPGDFDGRPNFDGPDPGHSDAGDDGVFPTSFPKLPFAPDFWDGADAVDVDMRVSNHSGGRYGAAADKKIYVDQFIDWNSDGVFATTPDPEHTIVAHSEDPSTWGIGGKMVTLPISDPVTHILGLPLWIRTRLAYGAAPGTAMMVPYGEVEDIHLDNFVEDFDTAFYVAPHFAPFPFMGSWSVVPDPDPTTGAANHSFYEWAKAPHPPPGEECTGSIESSHPMGLPPMMWEEYTAASLNFTYAHDLIPCGPVGLDACKMVVFKGSAPVLTAPIPPGSGRLTFGLSAYTGTTDPIDIAFIAETDDQGYLYIDDITVVAFDEHKPETITTLALSRTAGSRKITASWTTPHENETLPASEGKADSYQVRYSHSPILGNADFFNAVPVIAAEDVIGAFPLPGAPGSPESITFDVPSAHQTYFVAVRTGDEVLNDTIVSNAPADSTTASCGVIVTSVLGSGITIVASPGDSVDVDFQVDNTGNAQDIFLLEGAGAPNGWQTYIREAGVARSSPIGLAIAAGGNATVTFGVVVPVAAADSTVETFSATATSTNGACADSDDVDILVDASAVGTPTISGIPRTASLSFAGPNPSRSATAFRLALTRPQSVRMELYEISGRRVKVLADGERLEAGFHDVPWDGTNRSGRAVSSGIYLLRVQSEELSETKQVVRLR